MSRFARAMFVRHAELEDEPGLLAVLGHERDARPRWRCRSAPRRQRAPADHDVAVARQRTEDARAGSRCGPSRAGPPARRPHRREPRTRGRRRSAGRRGAAAAPIRSRTCEPSLARGAIGPWIEVAKVAPDHEPARPSSGVAVGRMPSWSTVRPSRRTVIRSAIGEHLVELVTDVDGRHALRSQLAQDRRGGDRSRRR